MIRLGQTLARHRRHLLAATPVAALALAVSCFEPLPLENRPCPCEVGFVCCNQRPGLTGTCVAGSTCQPGVPEPCDGGSGCSPDEPGRLDMIVRMGDDTLAPDDAPAPVNPQARPGDVLRLSSITVDTIPAFVSCLRASLLHTDGTESPLVSFDGLVTDTNLNPQVVTSAAPECPSPPGQPPFVAGVTGLAPGEGDVQWTWQSGDITLTATVHARVLPYTFRIASDKVVVPQHEQAALPLTVTVLDQNGQAIEWGGPDTIVSASALRFQIEDESVARLWGSNHDWSIEGLKPGLTTYTLHYFFPYGPEYINPPQDVVVLDDTHVTGLSIRVFERQSPYDEIASGQVLLPGTCYEARGFALTRDSSGDHTEALGDARWSTEGTGASLQSTAPAILCAQPQGHGTATLKLCARDLCTTSSHPVVDPTRLQLTAAGPGGPSSPRQVGGRQRLCPPARVTGHYLDDGSTADLTGDPLLVWTTTTPSLPRATDPGTGDPLLDGAGNPCFDLSAGGPSAGTPLITTINYVGGPAAAARFEWVIGP